MAERYTERDLDYIYRTVLGYDDRADKDLKQFKKNLGNSFTLADLQGLQKKGNKLNDQALADAIAYMQGAEEQAATAPAPAPTTPPPAASGPAPDPLSPYTAGFGPVGNTLTSLLGQGPQAPVFRSEPTFSEGYAQGALNQLHPTQASPLEQMISQQVMGGPGGLTPAASPLEQAISQQVMGGLGGMTPAASQFETMLATMAANPYLSSLAQGQIPPVMQQALDNSLKLSQANTMERLGVGQGTLSSDLAQYLNRTESDARTAFLADMAQQAAGAQGLLGQLAGAGGGLYNARQGLGANLLSSLTGLGLSGEQSRRGLGANLFSNLAGLGMSGEQSRRGLDLSREFGYLNPLFGTETNRGENALNRYLGLGTGLFGGEQQGREQGINRMFNDYLTARGMPPELAGLLALAGLGGGTSTTTGTGTVRGGQSAAQGADMLSGLGSLGGLLTSIYGGARKTP